MDELKQKHLENIVDMIEGVTQSVEQAHLRHVLNQLYERKTVLQGRSTDITLDTITRSNIREQLKDVDRAIEELTPKIDLSMDIDIGVDEEDARRFLEENPDIFSGSENLVAQDDVLTQLERDLCKKK